LVFGKDGTDKECIQNFDGEISWDTFTWNTEGNTDNRLRQIVRILDGWNRFRIVPNCGFSISVTEPLGSPTV